MDSEKIQDAIYDWAVNYKFNAPYGVLRGEGRTMQGTKYRSVTFGYARTLDATVNIYNRNFMIVNSSRHGKSVYKDFNELMKFLRTL